MKPYPIFMLCFLLSGFIGFAQLKENTQYNIWAMQSGDTSYVYSRMANIRTAPGTDAALQDSLPAGTRVIIISQDTVLQQARGIYAPWAKIKYSRNDAAHEGYVWLGNLELGSFQKDATRFIYGIEKIIPSKNNLNEDFKSAVWYLKLKAVDAGGALADEQEIKMEGPETSYCDGKLLGDMGLENTTDIVRLNFGGEACGIPTYYYYFGWTGNKMLPLPGKMEVGDAGVYYHTETFLFPKEPGGQPNKIIKLTEEGEADEEKTDKNGEPIFKIKKSRQVWVWNGSKAVKGK